MTDQPIKMPPALHEAVAADLQPGNRLLLDDGRLELRVDAVDADLDT